MIYLHLFLGREEEEEEEEKKIPTSFELKDQL